MQTVLPPPGRRTGATWVAATGAFLLLTAAAVFVAVHWDELTDAVKLAIVAGVTAGCLAGGRSLGRTLPATGSVVFHLGAFLLPVDLAAVGLRLEVGWEGLLLAEGVLCVTAFPVLARLVRSPVLAWAGAASMLGLAGGVAAVTPAPAPLVLAVVAAGAAVAGAGPAVPWAALAGLSPVLTLALLPATRGETVLIELGFVGAHQVELAVLTGVVSALVLGGAARTRGDLTLAYLALAAVGGGAGASWAAAETTPTADALALPALFLVAEATALVVGRDPFWRSPLATVATGGEWLARLIGTPVAVAFVALSATHEPEADPVAAGALTLLVLGWLAADLRRAGTARRTTFPLVVGLAGAVAAATASPVVAAAALLAGAGAAVATGRRGAPTAAAVSVGAVALMADHGLALPVTGAAGAAVVGWAAVLRARLGGPEAARDVVLGVLAGALLVGSASAVVDDPAGPLVLVAAVAGSWALAAGLDRGGPALGTVGRLAGLALLVPAASLARGDALGPVAVLAVVAAADAVRTGDVRVAWGAAVAVQALVADAAGAAGLGAGATARALAVAAVVTAGLGSMVDGRWRSPFALAAALGGAGGVLVAADAADPAAMGDCLLLATALATVGLLCARRTDLLPLGGVPAVVGVWFRLADAGVTASEAYLLPAAALMAAGGARLRAVRPGVGSWLAYGPAILLLGGDALLERLGGGGGGHALVAGAVGVAAVAAGGARRLAGPLVLGTALLVALTGYESLAVVAGVPTWAWLAVAGTGLLGLGVALERAETSPVEAGRRVADVLAERFE